MALLEKGRPHKKGMIRGRESRNQTISTKLTESEFQSIVRAAEGDGKTLGEWTRDLLLRHLRQGADDSQLISLAETVGVRLLLVNVLRSLACGQRLTQESFDKLLDEISRAKHELASKLLAERK